MTGIAFDQPVRDIVARSGAQSNCAGYAKILIDVEPAELFEFVDADDKASTVGCDDALVGECADAVRRGVVAELDRLGQGQPPAVRVVLRRLFIHVVDAVPWRYEEVGRMAVAEAWRRRNK